MTLLLNSLINNSLIKDGLTGDSLIVNTLAFIPTDLENAKVWLTYLDSDTVIRDVSDVVSQWDDKSGNDNHATAPVASLQPTYVDGEGILFNGAGNLMFSGSVDGWTFLHNGTGSTVFLVFKTTVADPNVRYGYLGTGNNASFQIAMEDRSSFGVNDGLYTKVEGDGVNVIEKYNLPDVVPQQQTNIVSVRYGTEAGVSNDFFNYVDGVELSALDNANTPSTADSTKLTLGYSSDGVYGKGYIKEVIIYDRKLSIEEHAQVIEYLKTQHTV